jgi:hypothetical protein
VPDTGPGDRQPKETTVAFEAFRTYLEMGPQRSTAKVARALGKSKTLMDRWSARWSWQRRVRDYEAQATATADAAHLDAVARRSKRQAEIAQLHGEASLTVAREVLRRLANPDEAAEALKSIALDELLRLEATLGRMHNRAVVTERLALGLTTEQSGEALPRTQAEEVARRMTDAELIAELSGVDELAAARDRRRSRRSRGDTSAADGSA